MNDKWLRILGYPVVIAHAMWTFHRESVLAGGYRFALALLISTTFTVAIWEGNRQIFRYAQNRFPGYSHTVRRIVWESILVVMYTFWVQVLLELILFYSLNLHPQGQPPVDWLACILVSLVPLPLFGVIYEANYFMAEWKKNLLQAEALARSHVQMQFDTLKKQLDPHFLFNSLNTLAYLIDLDNEPAQQYLSRLSDLYRYVLDTRDRATVSLEDELKFLDDYLYLNKVRFRENIQVERALSAQSFQRRIPALSLQLLVENAIKHNACSPEQPLHIRIAEEDDGISVSNNKQIRASLIASTRLGLQNLREQYQLLTSRPVKVVDSDSLFTVHIPFVEPRPA